MIFEDIDQAYQVKNEWATRLGLQDWLLQLEMKPEHKMSERGRGGEIYCHYTEKCAMITLVEADPEELGEYINKFCHEVFLVHELLHAKFPTTTNTNGESYELAYLNQCQHQLIDDIAKALVMAKYNLPLEWFKNFSEGRKECV
jgi:hypothetical protein